MKTIALTLMTFSSALVAEITPAKKSFEYGDFTLNYQTARMAKVDAKPPLVLFLHGAGERGTDNEAQLKHGIPELLRWLAKSGQACEVIAPQCPPDRWWANYSDYLDPTSIKLEDEPGEIMGAVLALVKSRIDSGEVDVRRVYITGLSMGGFATFAALAYQPDYFAAAAPICGGGDASRAKEMSKVPFTIVHGEDDEVVPVSFSRAMHEALKDAGGSADYIEFMLTGHDSWTPIYRNPAIWEWIFSQKKGESPAGIITE